ncbi:biotin/lipoyl-containing protein, partial [Capnocytophaga gingivalis]
MAEIVNMPRLSDTMEEGVVAKWLKKVGDTVKEGDILAEIETDKATMEFESFYSGTLLYIGLKEGESAPVDTLLAIIGEKGEDISALVGGGAPAPAKEAAPAAPAATAPAAPAAAPAAMPAGVQIVTMPRLSDTMTEGTVASWLKKVGDTVKEGDILAEIETDKATMEFESFYAGTLLYIGIKEGESAPIDSLLAIIGPAGTDVNAVLAAAKGGASAAPAAPAAAEAPKAAEAPTAAAPAAADSRVFASPLAKKIAQDKGIDLSQVKGTGENGRIVRKDVEGFTPSAKPATAAAAPAEKSVAPVPYIPVGEEVTEEVKNSQMRKTIAKRLSESKFTAPHYYLTVEVDMDNAMESRTQINNLPDTKVSFNDMVVKACAMALRKHPQVNTSWKGDVT